MSHLSNISEASGVALDRARSPTDRGGTLSKPPSLRSSHGWLPWSPLARGILTGSYRGGFAEGATERSRGGDWVRTEGLYRGAATFEIADRVGEVAEKYGKAPAQIALAWLVNKPEIACPVVGVSKIEQLDQLVEATTITLEDEDVAYLEELYRPLENLLSIGTS